MWRKRTFVRPAHRRSMRVKHPAITRLPSHMLPRRPPRFSGRIASVCCAWRPPWPTRIASPLLKTRNQLYGSCGGWIPARIQIDRASTMRGWFMRNRIIVALPVGVKPRRTCPCCIHSKCSDQRWILGLNRGTVSAVSGSGAAVAFALLRLQLGQDKQRFSSASGPSG
jgi:hypothetical protein